MKRLIAILSALTLLFSVTAFAEDEIKVMLNGTQIEFSDQKPVIVDGRTLVPMRVIFETLKCEVEWDNEQQRVSAKGDGITVELKIDDSQMLRNGEAVELDVPPMLMNNRTLVPLRAVAQAFNMNVSWDNESRSVVISDKKPLTFDEKFPEVPAFECEGGKTLKDEDDHRIVVYPSSDELSQKAEDYRAVLKEQGFERQVLGIFYPYVKNDTTVFIIPQYATDGNMSGMLFSVYKTSAPTAIAKENIKYYEEVPTMPSLDGNFGVECAYKGSMDGVTFYRYDLTDYKLSVLDEYGALLVQEGFMKMQLPSSTTYMKVDKESGKTIFADLSIMATVLEINIEERSL